jgi:hypothetical protein
MDLLLLAGLLQLAIPLGMNLPSPEKRDYRHVEIKRRPEVAQSWNTQVSTGRWFF